MREYMNQKQIKNIILILLGNSLYAAGIVMFILPNGLISGGTTGIALLLFHQFGIPISWFVYIFNFAMFLLGAFILGKKFAITTVISTFYYPFILDILQQIPGIQGLTSDTMLSTIFAGIMIGVGIGIVIGAGASTGGMDIPPLILNHKLGIPVSVSLYVFDFCILLSQIVFTQKEKVLYGLLLVMIYTVVLDKILLVGKNQTQVKIISNNYQEICEQITNRIDRGCTLLKGETGYMHKDISVVLTVISDRELSKLNRLVLDIDPGAFIIISHVNEVRGQGFTTKKQHLDLKKESDKKIK